MSLLTQFYGSGGGGGTGLPVEILLVGGGGGGGGAAPFTNAGSGGGGSGQFLYGTYHFDYDKSVTVTIGAGGAGGTDPGSGGTNWWGFAGGDSRFGYVVAYGGGGGGAAPGSGFSQYNPNYRSNQNYGSSGGVLAQPGGQFHVIMGSQPLGAEYITRLGDFGGPRTIDSGDTNNSTESYALIHGFISGRKTTPHGFIATGAGNIGQPTYAGGGGGAGGAPPGPISTYSVLGSITVNPSQSANKYITNGGAGLPGSVIGYPTLEFAGGGGGGCPSPAVGAAPGDGQAGGGDGGAPAPQGGLTGGDATANSGSGGGGGANAGGPTGNNGGSGGSGVCIIRYPTEYSAATVSGNTPTPAQPGYHVYRWNGPGSITFNS